MLFHKNQDIGSPVVCHIRSIPAIIKPCKVMVGRHYFHFSTCADFSPPCFIPHMQFFLDPLKSGARQYPDSKASQWVLHFGVKYYVPDPHLLKDDFTKLAKRLPKVPAQPLDPVFLFCLLPPQVLVLPSAAAGHQGEARLARPSLWPCPPAGSPNRASLPWRV